MKQCIICGLWAGDYPISDYDYLKQFGEIWVINDWYQFTPWITPVDRIYNLHWLKGLEHARKANGRLKGNWKAVYRGMMAKGARVYMLEPAEGLEGAKQFDTSLLDGLGPEHASCSISTLITVAQLEGYERITVIGVPLTKAEYAFQAHGVIAATERASAAGARVDWLPAGRWESLKMRKIDWAAIKPLKRYWDREVVQEVKEMAVKKPQCEMVELG